ncbi:MAG: PQQ-like beta-propeller repeat protein [Opitutaceae bacterium]|nr:PQQ-like beta-propeller repeat protein [Opitutaceae bacterium]
MKPLLRVPLLGIALSVFCTPLALANYADSWPTWRGASGAGIAPAAQPPLKWSDTENIKWKTKIPGSGFSTPIIWKDRIFLLTAIEVADAKPAAAVATAPREEPASGGPKGGKRGDRKGGGGFGGGPAPTNPYEFVVLALDRGTGKIVWQKTAKKEMPHEGHHASHGYASASPVTDGEHLYVSFGSRGFFCYDLNGNLKWEKDLGDMRSRGGFGEGASPAVAGGLLIINWDHEDQSFIVALDKKTGAEVWRKNRDERSSWSTPLIVEVNGRLQAIVEATNRTRSYDVLTGDVVWEASGMTANVIPTPVTGHGMVYLTSGFQGRSVQAIKLTSRGDISDTDNIVWSSRKQSTPYVPSPVLSGDRLYLCKSNDAYLSCLNALTGDVHYQDQPLPGVRGIYASPLAANGHLYVVGREGTVMVLKDAPKFEVVATNKLSDKLDASPVMLGKELFLRGHEHLFCISE